MDPNSAAPRAVGAPVPCPLVTVITPCLNAAATIGDTLASVAAAREDPPPHGRDLDHLILDGGSRDATPELVASHAATHPSAAGSTGWAAGPTPP